MVGTSEGTVPLLYPVVIGFDQPDVIISSPKGLGPACEDVTAIGCRLDCEIAINPSTTKCPVPLFDPVGIGLDQPNVITSGPKGLGPPSDDVTAVRRQL